MKKEILFSTRPEYDHSDRFITEFEGLVTSEEKNDNDIYYYHIIPTYSNILDISKITDMVIAEGILDNGYIWREITYGYGKVRLTESIVSMVL